jgi:hypothetical protein
MQALVGLNRGGVVAVFPERPLSPFAGCIPARCGRRLIACFELCRVVDEEMNVTRCHRIREHGENTVGTNGD